ncbi:MAG: LLM class flavin-dependent oxidoreductase [Acidobacteria bacterium]|nr:LLM class flavin-dependent oxidoreductase [Acidobacteriota bacterium]
MNVACDIGILPDRSAMEVAKLSSQAEMLGFQGIWVADSQCIFRDVYAALTLCAVNTRKLTLATGVTNPLTRHPAVTACSIATVDEISSGRTILGIGTGESAVHTLEEKPATLALLEEYTGAIRALLDGEMASYRGKRIRMSWTPPRRIPIYFASSGPRSLLLAGRLADGVLFQAGSDPLLIRNALEQIRTGAEQSGRTLDQIQLCARLGCAVSHSREEARAEIKPYAAVASGTIFASLPSSSLPEALAADMKRLKEHYDYQRHASFQAGHLELVTDQIIDAVAVAGTPDEVSFRLHEIMSTGINRLVIPMNVKDPIRLMNWIAEIVA